MRLGERRALLGPRPMRLLGPGARLRRWFRRRTLAQRDNPLHVRARNSVRARTRQNAPERATAI
eukprot:6939060-Prymnesium_polylepis.1